MCLLCLERCQNAEVFFFFFLSWSAEYRPPSQGFPLCLCSFIYSRSSLEQEGEKGGGAEKEEKEWRWRRVRWLRPNDFIAATETLSALSAGCLQQSGLISREARQAVKCHLYHHGCIHKLRDDEGWSQNSFCFVLSIIYVMFKNAGNNSV